MKIKKIQLIQFKRFYDLTVNLGETPSKIVALVGPNGCGKSSIFDALEEKLKDIKRSHRTALGAEFFSKSKYAELVAEGEPPYERGRSIKLEMDNGDTGFTKKGLYIRSSYRFTSSLQIESISKLPDAIEDPNRPSSSIDLDVRLKENYERLIGQSYEEYYRGIKTGQVVQAELLGKINEILEKVVDIKISSLGNILEGKGKLYFEKGSSKNFPYENLSSGEKEVVDLIIDLVVKTKIFDNTVYCIDEPELHLNTSIQRRLLLEIEKLIPDNCQLWVATHSIGFLRALQVELKDKTAILDFSEKDYFNGTATIEPMTPTRAGWQRIFQTALEDLTGLLAPEKIIYCEGKIQRSLDEKMFNIIFGGQFPDTLFLSSGNKDAVEKYAAVALTVLNKAFTGVSIIALVDRDEVSAVTASTKSLVQIKTLARREFENYLLDSEILKKFCEVHSTEFNQAEYDRLVTPNINEAEVKDQLQSLVKETCGINAGADVKEELANLITPDTVIYAELVEQIFT